MKDTHKNVRSTRSESPRVTKFPPARISPRAVNYESRPSEFMNYARMRVLVKDGPKSFHQSHHSLI
jgi:hypothetical protein